MGLRPGRKKLTVVTFAPRAGYRDKPKAAPPPKPSPAAPQPAPSLPAAAEPKPLSPAGRRKLARRAALAWLKITYPHLFGRRPPKPLAVGISAAIVAQARAAGFKPYAIGTALHCWTNDRRYLEALAADGAMRRALNGAPVEPVADEHQTYAGERLAEQKAAKAAPP
jgi:hypothetical protein